MTLKELFHCRHEVFNLDRLALEGIESCVHPGRPSGPSPGGVLGRGGHPLNVEPAPTWLSTQILPPSGTRTSCIQRGTRPNPNHASAPARTGAGSAPYPPRDRPLRGERPSRRRTSWLNRPGSQAVGDFAPDNVSSPRSRSSRADLIHRARPPPAVFRSVHPATSTFLSRAGRSNWR
jgi:hypothetical protein